MKQLFGVLVVGAGLVAVATQSEASPKAMAHMTHVVAHAANIGTQSSQSDVHCPDGMVEVKGAFAPVVEQLCTKWEGETGPARDRCAEYKPNVRTFGAPKPKHFCVDRYEWPNRAGEKPTVGVTWEEARDQCKSVGKRLCKSEEWTVACEGAEHLPYPTGYKRDRDRCNYDRPYILPDNDRFANPATRLEEMERLDQRKPSGSMSCESPYGVSDMVGNVDEWVVNETGTAKKEPYESGLKGGYWGPVRNRCRPMTTDHNRWHSGYQIGFRCCTDPK